MYMKNEEKLKIVNINLYTSIAFIFTVIVSTLLTYNEKLELLEQKPLFDKNNEKAITSINRFILIVIAIVFVYTAYQEYKLNQTEGKKNKTKVSLINFIINDAQLIITIVIALLPLIYPDDSEQINILIP